MAISTKSTDNNTMERPAKRQRMDWDHDFVMESDQEYPPNEAALEEEHQRNVLAVRNKLKHRFEDIFLKYERDFSGIGDEIDLETGEVIVDNGHLDRMRDEQDADGLSDESSETSNTGAYLGVDSSLHGKHNGNPYIARHRSRPSVSSSRHQTPPRDPRWAAPEVPGLSHDLTSLDESDLADALPTVTVERSPSPEVSVWDMSEHIAANGHKDPRSRWTFDELSLLCRLKNTDQHYTMRAIQKMLPHRALVSIKARWMNIEKGADPAIYLRNKPMKRYTEVVSEQLKSQPRLSEQPQSQPRSASKSDNDDSEADELTQPTPVGVKSIRHLAVTPRSPTVDPSPSSTRKTHAAVSPHVAHLAHTEAAPLSSSPITSAITWLSRSTDIEPFGADIAPTSTPKDVSTSKSPTKGPVKSLDARQLATPKTAEVKLEDPDDLGSMWIDSARHNDHYTAAASPSSDEEDTLAEIPIPALAAVKSPFRPSHQPPRASLLPREIPDSDEPISSSRSSQPQQLRTIIPDSEDHPDSSKEAAPLNLSTTNRNPATPSKRMSKSKKSHSRERKGATRPRFARQSLPAPSHTPTSLSLVEISSDDEQITSNKASFSSARNSVANRLGDSSLTASAQRPQCGRDGFSCGRIICLRCA